jgi:hypothetical protein
VLARGHVPYMPNETQRLRRPLFIIAYALLIAAVALETGAKWFPAGARVPTTDSIASIQQSSPDSHLSSEQVSADLLKIQLHNEKPPGYGVQTMALMDAILLLAMTWMLLALIVPQRIQGRVQGIVTLLAALLILFLSYTAFQLILNLLTTMISLFLAPPFGTLIYFAIWGFFDRGTAEATLSVSMLFKLGFVILLLLAQPTFLKVKSMMLLILTSLLLNIIAAFLLRLVPAPLASITDAIAGIVDSVAALIWAAFLLFFSFLSILRAIRVDRGSTQAEG